MPKSFFLVVPLLAVILLIACSAPQQNGKAPVAADTQQVTVGERLYTESCAMCHGQRLQGVSAPPLDVETLIRYGTAQDLFAFISTRMPPGNPGGLEAGSYYSIEAYILNTNDMLPAGSPVLGPQTAGQIPLERPAVQ